MHVRAAFKAALLPPDSDRLSQLIQCKKHQKRLHSTDVRQENHCAGGHTTGRRAITAFLCATLRHRPRSTPNHMQDRAVVSPCAAGGSAQRRRRQSRRRGISQRPALWIWTVSQLRLACGLDTQLVQGGGYVLSSLVQIHIGMSHVLGRKLLRLCRIDCAQQGQQQQQQQQAGGS